MVSSIRKFWQCLDSAVHPYDANDLSSRKHPFKLDFPPPAFIGDVCNAPVVILAANGGYSAGTPSEFPTQGDHAEYIRWLKGERKDAPRNLARYYTNTPVFGLVRSGAVTIVNAVAYRSTTTSGVESIAKHLASVKAHKKWLREEVLPFAAKGTRLVIIHRWKLWDLPGPRETAPEPNVWYTPNQRLRSIIPKAMVAEVKTWLTQHGYQS